MEKAGDWLMTKEGRHAALDGIGIFLEPADLVNAVLYLVEGELGDAALSGVSMLPMLGDLFGKGGKGTKYLLKAADLTKLNRNKKVVKVLENIDIFIKARKADMGELQEWIRKSLDNLAHGGDEVIELVTPDGIKVRISGDLRANVNLMDETGDMLQDTVRVGEKAGDGGEALKSGSKIRGYKVGFDEHLVKGTMGKGGKGVVGGHNFDEFKKVLLDAGYDINDCIVDITEHPSIKGIYEVRYRIPARQYGATGNLEIIPNQYKIVKYPKTVYEPSIISDEQMIQWGKEAMDSGIINGRNIYGYASNGLRFEGYIDETTGAITNFYPVLE